MSKHAIGRAGSRVLWLAMCAVLAAALTRPAGAQRETTMAELLSGATYPLKIKASELTASWSKFHGGSTGDQTLRLMYGQNSPLVVSYYTQGQQVNVGAYTFLIAYEPPAPGLSQSALGSAHDPAELAPQHPRKLTASTELRLTLLNLGAIQSLTDIAPVVLADELVSEAEVRADAERERAQVTLSNIRQIATGIMMYCQDYDEKFPSSATGYKQQVFPYIKSDAVFTAPPDPKGSVSYAFNRRLQARGLADVSEPARTVLVYEGAEEKPLYRYNGLAAIAFADGHVKLCSPDEVAKLDWGRNLPPLRPPPAAPPRKAVKPPPRTHARRSR